MSKKPLAITGLSCVFSLFIVCLIVRADGPPAPPGMDDDGGGGHGGAHTFSVPDPGDGGYATNGEAQVPLYFIDYTNRSSVYLFPPVALSSNSISLTLTNGATNGVYDLFGTTNLNPLADGLNLTNWLWLARGASGQTNFVLTNLDNWPKEGWFLLGTTNDLDADGLTDAFENLVSHTLANNADTDGDGVNDYLELIQGRNPRGYGLTSDTNNLIGLQIYTPLNL